MPLKRKKTVIEKGFLITKKFKVNLRNGNSVNLTGKSIELRGDMMLIIKYNPGGIISIPLTKSHPFTEDFSNFRVNDSSMMLFFDSYIPQLKRSLRVTITFYKYGDFELVSKSIANSEAWD